MSETCKCAVCKSEFPLGTGFVTEKGPVCGMVCAQYLNEQRESGRLDEGDEDLNEVQILL